MSGVSYHEMAVDLPVNMSSQRKQYLMLSAVGVGVFLVFLGNAGGFDSIRLQEESFGGAARFVYKAKAKDYATSMGETRCTLSDLINSTSLSDNAEQAIDVDFHGWLYSVFIDDPAMVPSDQNSRYFNGANATSEQQETLLKVNEFSEDEFTKTHEDFCKRFPYEVATLPPSKAGVLRFPFTNGFVSALVFNYKVLPALLKYGKEHGVANPVVITTCSVSKSACTHYVPLENANDFLLGRTALGQTKLMDKASEEL